MDEKRTNQPKPDGNPQPPVYPPPGEDGSKNPTPTPPLAPPWGKDR
jgi:hypothetical protein